MVRKKAFGILGGFLAVMLVFTMISRAVSGAAMARVETVKISTGTIDHTVSGSGKVEAGKEKAVYTESGQRVKEICVQEGQSVKQGETLFLLDLDHLEEQILAAQQELEKIRLQNEDAKSSLETQQESRALAKKRAQEDYSQAVTKGDADVAKAKADWDAAEGALQEFLRNNPRPGGDVGAADPGGMLRAAASGGKIKQVCSGKDCPNGRVKKAYPGRNRAEGYSGSNRKIVSFSGQAARFPQSKQKERPKTVKLKAAGLRTVSKFQDRAKQGQEIRAKSNQKSPEIQKQGNPASLGIQKQGNPENPGIRNQGNWSQENQIDWNPKSSEGQKNQKSQSNREGQSQESHSDQEGQGREGQLNQEGQGQGNQENQGQGNQENQGQEGQSNQEGQSQENRSNQKSQGQENQENQSGQGQESQGQEGQPNQEGQGQGNQENQGGQGQEGQGQENQGQGGSAAEWDAQKSQLDAAVAEAKSAYEAAVSARTDSIRTAARAIEDAAAASPTDSTAEQNEISRKQQERVLGKLQSLQKAGGKVTAPVDGMVTQIAVTTGDFTTEGTAVRLADTSQGNRLVASVDKSNEAYVQKGGQVTISPAGSKEKLQEFTVSNVSINKENNTLIDISIDLPPGVLEPGTSAEIKIVQKSSQYSSVVPVQALYEEQSGYYVLLLREQQGVMGQELVAERMEVEVLEKNSNYAALQEGLLTGEQEIISVSSRSIGDGSRVRRAE